MNRKLKQIYLFAIMVIVVIIIILLVSNKDIKLLKKVENYLNEVESIISEGYGSQVCEVGLDGNLLCDDSHFIVIDTQETKPSGGIIIFDEGKIINASLFIKNQTVRKNENGKLLFFKSKKKICKLIEGSANTIGAKYQCKVKNNMEAGFKNGYYFYVLSHNEDGTTNLIMDRNIYYDEKSNVGKVSTSTHKGLVAWHNLENNESGPSVALQYLHNATKDWNNVPNMIMVYEDENIKVDTQEKGKFGYGKILTFGIQTVITDKVGTETLNIENLKSRMPRYDEVHGINKCLTNHENNHIHGSCPLWLSDYLDKPTTFNDLKKSDSINGYWTLSTEASSDLGAWAVGYYGDVYYEFVNYNNTIGVRPVINLKL